MLDDSYLDDYLTQIKARFEEAINPATALGDAIVSMNEGARRLNQTFGGVRQRITELSQAVADAQPKITSLGGTILDTFSTLEEISTATKRNIVGSAEEVSKLFAASKITGSSVKELVTDFTEVGVQISRIGPELEKSINEIQNIGLNVSQIMGDAQRYMDKLNEYNFEKGVVGLSKMAANAAVFKFDMQDTFRIAEKALRPDGAIELASAFQRMGVAVGQLTDPFQLMNMSLNDPEGLQKSLSQMTKQYAEFDEKTKTFKISPAGMLQMRELADQTTIGYESLSKSALAAANFDKAISQLKPEISFKNEEDKMLLANVAKMNDKGEYTVTMKKDGEDKTYKLSELTNEQIAELLEQQKTAPKTLEEIQRASLDQLTVAASDIAAIKEKVAYGVTSADQIRNFQENVRMFVSESSGIANKAVPETPEIRRRVTETINQVGKEMVDLYNKFQAGTLSKKDFEDKAKAAEAKIDKLSEEFGEGAADAIDQMKQKFEDRFIKINPLKTTVSAASKKGVTSSGGVATSNINMGGVVTFKIEATNGISKNDLETFVNSTTFKEKIYQLIRDVQKEKGFITNKTP